MNEEISVDLVMNDNPLKIQLRYSQDAYINSCKKLQFQVFQKQAASYQNLMSTHNDLKLSKLNHVATRSLTRLREVDSRVISYELNSDSRYIDDLEITLLSILDSGGYVSSKSHIIDILLVMTRTTLKVL